MFILKNIYNSKNICAFESESDAFEIIMSLVEEAGYEMFLHHYLEYGNTYEGSLYAAKTAKKVEIENYYIEEIPYLKEG